MHVQCMNDRHKSSLCLFLLIFGRSLHITAVDQRNFTVLNMKSYSLPAHLIKLPSTCSGFPRLDRRQDAGEWCMHTNSNEPLTDNILLHAKKKLLLINMRKPDLFIEI